MIVFALNTLLILILALPLAILMDLVWGEPPARFHPVVWMGQYLNGLAPKIAARTATLSRLSNMAYFFKGAVAWTMGALMVGFIAVLLQVGLLQLPWWCAAPLLAGLLKPMLSWRMLLTETMMVELALGESLDAGRQQLSRLVSRDVQALDAMQVREAAIESLAENLNDSVIAPIFWFVCLGLPGAAIYRFANTADAMWGYRGMRSGHYWEYSGKWAARVDDVMSWLPARVTAMLLLAASPKRAWKVAQQLPSQARLTPSPNGGWPMAAMALLLGVQLHKPGIYALNVSGRAAQVTDMFQAQYLCKKAVVAGISIGLFAIYFVVV